MMSIMNHTNCHFEQLMLSQFVQQLMHLVTFMDSAHDSAQYRNDGYSANYEEDCAVHGSSVQERWKTSLLKHNSKADYGFDKRWL